MEGIVTEVKEELGLDITGMPLEIFSEGCDGADCYKMYYLKIDINIETLKIQEDELTEVKWFSMQELQDMVDGKILNPNQIACFVKCSNFLETRNDK